MLWCSRRLGRYLDSPSHAGVLLCFLLTNGSRDSENIIFRCHLLYWFPVTHVGSLHGALDPEFKPGPAHAAVATREINQQMDERFSPFLPLFSPLSLFPSFLSLSCPLLLSLSPPLSFLFPSLLSPFLPSLP